jgi:zinc protease
MAHFFEHLMFRESRRLAEGEYDRAMEQLGAQVNAATWLDWTCFHAKAPSEHLPTIIDIEAERLAHVVVGPTQLEGERKVVLNERQMRVEDDPDGKMDEVLWTMAFGREHPYGWPTLGWAEDIARFDLADCRAFHEAWYGPSNTTLVIVGDVDPDVVCQHVDRHYGAMTGASIADEPFAPTTAGGQSVDIALDISSERVSIAFPAPRLGSLELAGWEVLNEILLGAESARLERILVEESEEALDVCGVVEPLRHAGVFQVDLTMSPGVSAQRGRDAVFSELKRIVDEGVGEREIARAAVRLEASGVQQILTAGGVAWMLGQHECTTGDFRDFFRHLEAVSSVTTIHVQQAARACVAHGGAIVLARMREGA